MFKQEIIIRHACEGASSAFTWLSHHQATGRRIQIVQTTRYDGRFQELQCRFEGHLLQW